MPRATVAPQTSQDEPPQKKNRAWIIAAAVLIVLALIAGGAVLLTAQPWSKGSGSTTSAGGRSEPSEPTTGSSTSDNQTLLELIKRERYQESDCNPLSPPDGTSNATYDCGTIANGPTSARFWLYPSIDTLNGGFSQITGKLQLENCPNSDKKPGDWYYDSSKDKIAGQVGCGSKNGTPALVWTENSKNFMGYIEGTSANALYKWWAHQ